MSPLEPSPLNPWHTTLSETVYEDQRVWLRRDQVVQPDGLRGDYIYAEMRRPIVAIVPVDDQLNVHMVRQWRYPWGVSSWEVPAGHGEEGEEPLAAAQRELAEEAGVRADRWEPLPPLYASAFVRARFHLFLARNLTPVQGFQRDAEEADLIVRRVPLQDAVQAATDGTIVHGVSVAALLRVARLLGV